MNRSLQTKVKASSDTTASFVPQQSRLLQRSSTDHAEPATVPSIVHEVLCSSGQPIDPATRMFMEPRFGHDFSRVRVHNDAPKMIQTKLTIGQSNDRYEQEADRVADAVMRMPEPRLQRQIEPEEEEMLQTKPLAAQITPLIQRQIEPEEEEGEEELIQAKRTSGQTPHATPLLQTQIHSLRGGGQPLSPPLRNFFEPRFGHDFSRVRVHTDAKATESARAVNALAYTVGQDVVFGAGQYAPQTWAGQRLLAHELTHVVQQNNTTASTKAGQIHQANSSQRSLEVEADSNSRVIESGGSVSVNLITSNKSIMRAPPGQTAPLTPSSLPYDATYAPSAAHCAIYQSPLARTWFTYSYRNNAECACLNTPDEPHNNCVRKCLQAKMVAHMAWLSRAGAALPLTFPLEADPMCHDMWEQHVECYRECGCNNEFINYPIFSVMCRMPFPCLIVGGSISWFNACI